MKKVIYLALFWSLLIVFGAAAANLPVRFKRLAASF